MPILFRPAFFRKKRQAQGCRVCGNIDVRGNRFLRKAWHAISGELLVEHILAVKPRPAVPTIFLQDVYFIWRQVIAQKVSAHLCGPDFSCYRMNRHENRVSKPFRKLFKITAVGVRNENPSPEWVALLANIARRTHGSQKFVVTRRRHKNNGSRKMASVARQINYFSAVHRHMNLFCFVIFVVIDSNLVGFGNVKFALLRTSGRQTMRPI